MFKRLLGMALVFGMAAAAPPASAQNCALRGDVIAKLQQIYSEELAFGGLQNTRSGQTVMEVWASRATGTYTVLMTHANGISCIVAAGTDFFEVTPRAAAEGAPS